MRNKPLPAAACVAMALCAAASAGTEDRATEFCLAGEFDLGARLQGMHPAPGEFAATEWCVITEDGSGRVYFRGEGPSNPDLRGSFAVVYLPPDAVRIVERDAPPDLEFRGADIAAEARRNRRLDPRRLLEELTAHPEWITERDGDGWQTVRYPGEPAEVRLRIADGRLRAAQTAVDIPLRGRVPVQWRWDWPDAGRPGLTIELDGQPLFRARGAWRALQAEDAAAPWQASGGEPPRQISGHAWPARIDMRLETLAEDVYIVRGVRTGFHHLVVDTGEGLLIGDAPAGWVELQQFPPADLVPGLGVSGLSEKLVDFLASELPGRPIRAVALTHAHDDHVGGARAFAAAGAAIYAPAAVSEFLESALNRDAMPPDRLSAAGGKADIRPVADSVTLGGRRTVRLLNIGRGPHVSAALGVWAVDAGYFFQSDLHVPGSDADTPRADRAVTECWFARWAAARLPPETVVLGSHGTQSSPVSRLMKYLDSAECRDRGG